jgi:ABC-type phosphate transport system substrate-binding protein
MKTILLISLLFFSSLTWAQQIVVIVNEGNSLSSISKDQLRDYFLKKIKTWPDGSQVKFFDRGEETKERNLFLKNFIERSSREVETFWIGQKLYTGHSAPTQVNNDSMAMALISRFPGAISYVSEDVILKSGIKKIVVTKD